MAAFNSGFRMQDAEGGFYADGVEAVPLRTGAASLVIDSNGTPNIGAWGTDVSMSPSVVAVRQNLDLIVDDGQPVPGTHRQRQHRWGATLGGKVQVWRSGSGHHRRRGPRLRRGLGPLDRRSGQRAGPGRGVRAMEMDINTAWVNFTSFDPPAGQPATAADGTVLTYDEATYPSRYFSSLSRDFVTMSAALPAAAPAPPAPPAGSKP